MCIRDSYVGVSLETFTGIIGTILGGIALGAAFGGSLADRHDPVRLIGLALFFGGGLTWLSLPIVLILGPNVGRGPVAIVTLAAAAFFLPAAVLSGIGPMVAKLELGSLEDTGAVVGKLSAAGTFGALAGTFGTGFILIAIAPVRAIIIGVGAVLVLAGIIVFAKSGRRRPDTVEIAAVIFAAVFSVALQSPCEITTDYFCVQVVADEETDREDPQPGGRSLILDRLRHAHVDLDDPLRLDIRYIRLFADVVESLPPGPIRVLHVGGGGFSLPRFINEVRPGSENVVLELDDQLVEIAQDQLGLTDDDNLDIRTGDARLHFRDLPTDGFDLIIGDAFAADSVPWHLTTTEVITEFERLLVSDGLYAMNVIDGDESRFARAQLDTLGETFTELSVIVPWEGIESFRTNQILLAANRDIPRLEIEQDDGRQLSADEVIQYLGDNRIILRDDFAPADQLLS